MLKAALGALIVVGAFAGALYAGGNVMGAWEPYEPTQPTGHPAGQPKQSPPAQQRGAEENRRWNARFFRLGAPRREARRFNRLRGLFREDEAILSDLAAAVRDRDGASAMLLGERPMSLARRESRLMVSLGARECAFPLDAAI